MSMETHGRAVTEQPPARAVRCRYVRRNDERCPNEAADQTPDAWIVLCGHHLARAMQCVRDNRKQKASRR